MKPSSWGKRSGTEHSSALPLCQSQDGCEYPVERVGYERTYCHRDDMGLQGEKRK